MTQSRRGLHAAPTPRKFIELCPRSVYLNLMTFHPRTLLSAVFSLLVLSACSSAPRFAPEVGGDGGKYSKGGVVYSIPPQHPVLKMKFVSMVIPKEQALHVQIYFVRKGSPAGEYMDPREQSVLLPDSTQEIHPSRVHANGAKKPMIGLADAAQQAVELIFPVPSAHSHDYPFILLKWKIHYQENGADHVMSETERFDYVQPMEAQEGVGNYVGDLEFPAVGYIDPLPPVWFWPGWLWW